MSVSVASKPSTSLRNRWIIAAAIVLAIAAALSIATVSRTNFAKPVRDAVSAGLDNIKTVAAMLADRSPGQRPEGALASLKHKKQPVLHQRALPKIRRSVSPLAGIVGTPPGTMEAGGITSGPPDTMLYSGVCGGISMGGTGGVPTIPASGDTGLRTFGSAR